MSCSARLPVYILFIGAFFPGNPTLVLIGLYFTGIVLAVITAHLFNKTLFKSKEAPFVMELPPYRLPTVKSIIKHMWDKSAQYLQKVGGVILIAVIIIWALGYFPQKVKYSTNFDAEINNIEQQLQYPDQASQQPLLIEKLNQLRIQKKREHLEKSWLGQIGHFIEPAIRPLGFDWRVGIALMSGTAAKEVVVSTIGVILQSEEGNGTDEGKLVLRLREMKHDHGPSVGKTVFTPVTALAFLLFVLIYFPCIGVVSAIAKESGRWRWAFFIIGYTTALAWLVAFFVNQIGSNLF